jgi:hypothetical protein
MAAGFLVGEFFAGHPPAALRRLLGTRRGDGQEARASTRLAERLQDRLDQALGPDSQSIELIPVGRNAVEVHGWVTSRAARARALRIARDALGPETRLIDGLLVWGEDDRPSREYAALDERESA